MKKRPNFYKFHTWAADKLGLCTPEMAIFSIIYSYETSGKQCWMSFTEFARECGISRPTVARALNSLEFEYQVIRRYSSECEYRNSNVYEIVTQTVLQWQQEFDINNV